jgi:hypothetical protein
MTGLVKYLLGIGILAGELAILHFLRRTVPGDMAALLGVTSIWLLAFAYFVVPAYGTLRSEDDLQGMHNYLRSRVMSRRRPLIAILLLLPGLWTGFVAEHPLFVSLLGLGVFEVCYTANRLYPSRIPMMSETHQLRLDRIGFRLLVCLAGTLAGLELRNLL